MSNVDSDSASAMPPWKRTLEELSGNNATEAEPAVKKQKVSNGSATPSTPASSVSYAEVVQRALAELETGLNMVASTVGISGDAKEHATALRKLLYKEASAAFAKESRQPDSQGSNTSVNHTDVPAPAPGFPAPLSGAHPMGGKTTIPPLPPITDLTLLDAPFTHKSALPEYMPATSTNTYEPLEFLGDAYLEVIATRLIHNRFPTHTVGQKAGLRELLIKNETLAQYARDYGMGERIKMTNMPKIDNKIGDGKWQKVLADVFEAYVACVILSDEQSGFKIAEDWLHELWGPKVEEWRRQGEGKQNGFQEVMSMDVKSELQRFLVSKGIKLEYVEEKPMELDKVNNRTTFFMGVYLTGWGYDRQNLGSGSGRSKQLAGAEAAKQAFSKSRDILEYAHRQKLEFDKLNGKKKLYHQ
ncbi:ribonuclease III [Microthyrium microscopicum]|uniref:Ribonuclease III n=1 Tax=Microthyrium microscopicum TaxID=703497 RepID=A0A6A6UCH3_9PEZI|nr:ribonuclease III [Microthyrium microscopicum]